MVVGDRIRELRKQRGWSAGQLLVQARRYIPEGKKLARETLSRIENGQPRVDLWILEACAQAFGVPLGELLDTGNGAGAPAVAEHGAGYAVAKHAAVRAPEVEALAQRLDELPAELRTRVCGLLEQTLGVVEEYLGGFSLAEPERLMLRYFQKMNDENQAVALAELRRLAELSAGIGARRGGRGTS